jgi:hypothetical protein
LEWRSKEGRKQRFLKKAPPRVRRKSFLLTWATGGETSAVQMSQKFFARFFSKKRYLLSSYAARRRERLTGACGVPIPRAS